MSTAKSREAFEHINQLPLQQLVILAAIVSSTATKDSKLMVGTANKASGKSTRVISKVNMPSGCKGTFRKMG